VTSRVVSELLHRDLARDDIRPGLRTTSYRKRTVIAFAILDGVVAIIGIFHGGRDHEKILKATLDRVELDPQCLVGGDLLAVALTPQGRDMSTRACL